MGSHLKRNSVAIACLVSLSLCIAVPVFAVELFYDASIKATYEDNVIGLLSDKRGGTAGLPASTSPGMMMGAAMGPGSMTMGGHPPQDLGSQSKSDESLNLFADIGASTEIGSAASAFLIGSAQHTFYNNFTELDNTMAFLGAGVNKKIGDIVTVKLAMSGGIKRYDDSSRDSSAYGPSITFKEELTPAFWLKENYYYEKNDADSPLFTYSGNSVSIWAGYLVLPMTRLLLGYNYLVREYDQPSGFKVTANTVSVGVEQALAKRWFIDGEYDHQSADSNVAGVSSTDNIISVDLRYSY